MAAPSIDVSATVTLVASTEQHITNNKWFSTIVVDNSTGTAEVYVATDGGTATVGGAHCEMVPANTTRAFGNTQALPNANQGKFYNGVDGTFSQSESVNWTAQLGYTGTNLTYCSVISTGTPNVTVTFE